MQRVFTRTHLTLCVRQLVNLQWLHAPMRESQAAVTMYTVSTHVTTRVRTHGMLDMRMRGHQISTHDVDTADKHFWRMPSAG